MISQEIERKILFFFLHEKWKIGTISKELRVHHETVRRVLANAGLKNDACQPSRKSIIEPHLPFLRETLEKHPDLTAARLFCMCMERGYKGSADHFRAMVRRVRPEKLRESFARLETMMGEQAQVDWGSFGKIQVRNGIRDLSAFVMVLSWSRAIYLEFFYDQRLSSFLNGHNNALAYMSGVPRVILYDNLKSVVTERQGEAIRFNRQFLEYASTVGFEPRPVGVRRGNEKGRVERAIRYIRDNFFAGRSFKDLEDINKQAKEWYQNVALSRRCQADHSLSVGQAFELEKGSLRTLPGVFPASEERITIRVPKVPLVRIDGNDYAVPHLCAYKMIAARISPTHVFLENDEGLVAQHKRCWDKKLVVDEQGFSRELVSKKPRAYEESGKWRLIRSLPTFLDYIRAVAEEGLNMGSTTAAIGRLLDSYGRDAVEKALREALAAGQLNSGAVALILDRERQKKGADIPLPVALPNDPRIKNMVVKLHDMEKYNSLMESADATAT